MPELYGRLVKYRRRLGIGRAFWYTWASVYGQFPHFGVQPTFQWTGFIKWKPTQPFTPTPLLKAYARAAAKYEGCRKTADARRCRKQ